MKRFSFLLVCGLAFLAMIAVAGSTWTANPAQPDPFALENQDPRSVQGAAPKRADEVRVDFKATAEPSQVAPGNVFKVIITGAPRPGFHTYPITIRAKNDAQPDTQLSRIVFEKSDDLKPLWPITEEPLARWYNHPTPAIGKYLIYDQPFTWSQDVLVTPKAQPGPRTLHLTVTYVACDEHNCQPATKTLEVPVDVTAAGAVPLNDELNQRLQTPAPAIRVVPQPPDLLTPDVTLVGLLLASMGAAVAMLFTPCVFPMIPITVTFFLKQSEQKHHNAPLTAAIYSVTIVIILSLAVLVLGKVVVELANSIWLNLGLAAVLGFFALSLFGMYDIELPAFLTRWTSAREGQGGYLGAVFMALTFTITSFTCTGPFLGPLLVVAKEAQLDLLRLIVASVAYAATFAAPFFVLALFPGLLKKLPKSGGWLNAVKVVMGFLELAAALKFLGNADITLNPGKPWFFTYDTVLVSWIALSIMCGVYLLGLIRLPHDTPQDHISVPRLVLATIFFGLGIYMTPALWGETPSGVLGQGLVAFLPLDTKPKKEPAFLDYESAWKAAVRENKLIFIDFTGVNCTNCRANELNVFTRPAVREELKRYIVVQLYNDTVPDPDLKGDEPHRQAERNAQLQVNTFGDASTPLYVILKPDPKRAIEDGKILGEVLARKAGYIHDRPEFLEMLRHPGQVRLDQ
jgi:thiol:disulfide interchange protein